MGKKSFSHQIIPKTKDFRKVRQRTLEKSRTNCAVALLQAIMNIIGKLYVYEVPVCHH